MDGEISRHTWTLGILAKAHAARRLKREMAERLRRHLMMGVPTNADEKTLRRLAAQLRVGKVAVKLLLRHALHAKLYLLYRDDPGQPHRRLRGQRQPHVRRAVRIMQNSLPARKYPRRNKANAPTRHSGSFEPTSFRRRRRRLASGIAYLTKVQ